MNPLQKLSKTTKIILGAGGVCVLAGGGMLMANAMEGSKRIDAQEALKIALSDAGVSTKDIEGTTKAVLEKEDGHSVYEVDFQTKQQAYEYTIASQDGDILDRSVEAIKKHQTATLSLAQAKQKAAEDAGVQTSAVQFTKAKLEEDDDQPVYDIEFIKNKTKYEYTISAQDGTVLKKEVKTINQTAKQTPANKTKQPTASDINAETAKQKALADAGVSHATFTKVKLDHEDGRQVYDIEFVTATMEYEYEIDAQSGAVIKRSKEAIKTKPSTSTPNASYIGVDKAKAIALQQAQAAANAVTFTKTKLENDDGIAVYEIEFRQGTMEYDFEIDAHTGAIISWDKDVDDD